MTTSKQIISIRRKIIPILKKNGVIKAGIFGSYARGEAKKTSDVDVLVKLKSKVSLFGFVRLKQDLEDTLQKKVDLVEYETIKPRLKEKILHDEIRIL